jgi:cobyrinic acid a,c-diamide synthase
MGTNAAAVRGALRADNQDLLTVVLPQSMEKQTSESQELLEKVNNVIAFPERDDMSLEMASKLCNSFLLNQTDQLISFAFHESSTVIEAAEEAKELQKLVTMLFLD